MNKKILIGSIAMIGIVLGIGALTGNKEKKIKIEGEKIEIEHRYGKTEVKKNPEKVVVLDYSTLDTMTVMEKKPIALPKANIPEYLNEYTSEEYIDLGELKKFNIEKINELKPDLIIIEGRQGEYYEELSKIAPTIGLGTVNDDHFESLKNNVKILGKIYGMESFASQKLNEINVGVNEIKEKVTKENRNGLLTMVSNGEISVFGEGSRFDSIYKNFGYKVSDKEIKVQSHGETISYEYLLEKNPEYLFVIDKGQINGGKDKKAEEVITNNLTKKMDAYKSGKIIYLDTKVWYLGGPGLMGTEKMIEEIKDIA